MRFQREHVGPGKQKKRLDVKDNSLLEDRKKKSSVRSLVIRRKVVHILSMAVEEKVTQGKKNWDEIT